MHPPDITVLLPTCQRPDMARIALQSIQAQTAKERIREVIVSESGRPSGMDAICAEFRGSLPIRYILRDPPMTQLEHERALIGGAYDTPFVAILHDDDAWLPDHLERALALLDKHATAALSCAAFRAIRHDGAPAPDDPYQYDALGMFWFAAGFPPGNREWLLGPNAVIMSCLPGTPLHYSSMVIRTRFLADCDRIYEFGNGYDKDRLLLLALARQGPVVYNPQPNVLVRIHAQQSVNDFALAEKLRHMGRTTGWALEFARERNFDFLAALHLGMAKCPPEELPRLAQIFDRPWVRAALAEANWRRRRTDPAARRRRILFVAADAAEGAPARFLLELLRWLRRETDQEFELFLGAGGPLEAPLAELARVQTFAGLARQPDFLRWSYFQQFDLIYSNGCRSGAILERLPFDGLPVVTQLQAPDGAVETGGAKAIAQVIRHTHHFIADSAALAESWRRRFGLPEDRITVHPTAEGPAAVAAAAPLLWQTMAAFLQDAPAAPRAAALGLCDIFETWSEGEIPDRAYVSAKLARHRARRHARALASEGRGAEAIQTLIRALRADNESKDPHRILEGLIEIASDLEPIDGKKAQFLQAEAGKVALAIGVELAATRARLAREGSWPEPAASVPQELTGAGTGV
jgi:hypothetical protein